VETNHFIGPATDAEDLAVRRPDTKVSQYHRPIVFLLSHLMRSMSRAVSRLDCQHAVVSARLY